MNQFLIVGVLLMLLSCAFLLKPFRPGIAKLQFGIVFLFVVGVAFVYYRVGHIQEWADFEMKESQVQSMLDELKSPEKVIDRLQQKLKQEPNSAEGWFLLGRLYRSINKVSEASAAFKNAVRFDPANSAYFNAMMEARFWENGGYFTKTDLGLMTSEHGEKQLDAETMNLLAGFYYQHQDYQNALAYWQKMSILVSDSPDVKQEVLKAVKRARIKQEQQKRGAVQVTLGATELVRKYFPAQSSVFIFVRISKVGPPLAVARRVLSELEDTIVLSDAESMLPNRLLSQYQGQLITIGARLEPSGKLTGAPNLPRASREVRFKDGMKLELTLQR